MSETLTKARARFAAPPSEPKPEPREREPVCHCGEPESHHVGANHSFMPVDERDQPRPNEISDDDWLRTATFALPSGMILRVPPFTMRDENLLTEGFRKAKNGFSQIDVIGHYFRKRVKIVNYGPYHKPFHVADMLKMDWDRFTQLLEKHMTGDLL